MTRGFSDSEAMPTGRRNVFVPELPAGVCAADIPIPAAKALRDPCTVADSRQPTQRDIENRYAQTF